MKHRRSAKRNEKTHAYTLHALLLVASAILLWQPVTDIFVNAPVLPPRDEPIHAAGLTETSSVHSDRIGAEAEFAEYSNSNEVSMSGLIASAKGHTILDAVRQHPCMAMSIPELLEAILEDDVQGELWGAVVLALRADEAFPFVETMLRHGTPWQQYRLARKLKEAFPERYMPTLLAMATDSGHHPQARVGACYALSGVPLDQRSMRRLLIAAEDTDSAIVRRTALISLSATDISGCTATVAAFLEHADPFTRLQAARLLLANNFDVNPATLYELAEHEDYLVRQEAYSVLGCFDDTRATMFLERAVAVERNLSASREARLSLRRQQARSIADIGQQAQVWLDVEDDLERWAGVQYALRQNQATGMAVLAAMAQEPSPMGEMSLAHLAGLLVTSSMKNEPSSPAVFTAGKTSSNSNGKHFFEIHSGMAIHSVSLHNAQPDSRKISVLSEYKFAEWVIREDFAMRPVNHAYNPLTGRGFVRQRGFGGSGRLYVSSLLGELDALYGREDFSNLEQQEAWQLAGRVFHVLEDMTSPLHVFSVWHVLNSCHVEVYWYPYASEARQLVEQSEVQPIASHELAPTSTVRMDAFTRAALEARIADMPDTLMGYMDALAWSTYYRASFRGQIRYGDTAADATIPPTQFDDVETEASPNVLRTMFDGNIRYHTAWWGDYFEIADRMGNTFIWNRLFALDQWRPCPNPRGQQLSDGHTIQDNGSGMCITGRFLFTHRGQRTSYCHPFAYPDGTPMAAHLPYYYGETLFPVLVAYGGGWLGMLAELYPKIFGEEITTSADQKNDTINVASILERITGILDNENPLTGERSFRKEDIRDVFQFYAPRCGCTVAGREPDWMGMGL